MEYHFDPPSGSYTAPVRATLVMSAAAPPLQPRTESAAASVSPLPASFRTATSAALNSVPVQQAAAGGWIVSIEHVDRIEDVFEAKDPSKTKPPPQRSIFAYDGPFRITRAGRMRVCAWPAHGSYENDRIVAVYFIENPQDAATSRGWIVEKVPPSSITHPITSFAPFTFELSAPQRYLKPPSSSSSSAVNSLPFSTSSSPLEGGGGTGENSAIPLFELPATVHMAWNYDRQTQAQMTQQRSGGGFSSSPNQQQQQQSIATAVFAAQTTVKAAVSTTWDWLKNTRWSNDAAESLEERCSIRVGEEGGMTKVQGLHGEWDAAVSSEAALQLPLQLDVIPLSAVNAVVGLHGEELPTPWRGAAWKGMDISLHFASLSGSGSGNSPPSTTTSSTFAEAAEEPEIQFRFFCHHPAPSAVRTPLIEGPIPARSVLSIRIVPDTAGAAKQFCEAKLLIDGHYVTSAFFPKRSAVKVSCLLSDPVAYPALQIVPRAPTTHIRVSNVFFGACPLGSPIDERRMLLQRQIAFELERARASTRGQTDPAHADPQCSVLFVDLRLDISPIEALPGIESAAVPLAMYWRPTWLDTVPLWTLKTISNASQSILKLFALESGRCVECFEEAPERNAKESSLLMQL